MRGRVRHRLLPVAQKQQTSCIRTNFLDLFEDTHRVGWRVCSQRRDRKVGWLGLGCPRKGGTHRWGSRRRQQCKLLMKMRPAELAGSYTFDNVPSMNLVLAASHERASSTKCATNTRKPLPRGTRILSRYHFLHQKNFLRGQPAPPDRCGSPVDCGLWSDYHQQCRYDECKLAATRTNVCTAGRRHWQQAPCKLHSLQWMLAATGSQC